VNATDRPIEYIGISQLATQLSTRALTRWREQSAEGDKIAASALEVTRHAVSKWRERHPAGSAHPFPAPDVTIDGAPGWLPNRVDEIEKWRQGLPGQGWRKGSTRDTP
jgi:hypothetical protein